MQPMVGVVKSLLETATDEVGDPSKAVFAFELSTMHHHNAILRYNMRWDQL